MLKNRKGYPIISVILPVFNVERYLEFCLNSLLNQDFDSYEIVIVDDSSTDMTSTIIKRYESISDRIRSFECNKPKIDNIMIPGNNNARRMAIENARGKYLMHFLAHSIAKKNMLTELYLTFINREDDKIVCVGCKEIGISDTLSGRIIYELWSIPRKFRLFNNSFVKRGIVFSLWKKSFLDEIGGFPSGGDTELNIITNKMNYKKLYIDTTGVYYIWKSSGGHKRRYGMKNSFISFFWKMVAYGNCRAEYCKKYNSSIAIYSLLALITFPLGFGVGFFLGMLGVDCNKSMGLV